MNAPKYLPEDVKAVWQEIVDELPNPEDIIGPEFEAYCGAIARLRDAQHRISKDGAICADAKGNPMPHPALAIERQCQDALRKWGNRFN